MTMPIARNCHFDRAERVEKSAEGAMFKAINFEVQEYRTSNINRREVFSSENTSPWLNRM